MVPEHLRAVWAMSTEASWRECPAHPLVVTANLNSRAQRVSLCRRSGVMFWLSRKGNDPIPS